MSKKASWKQKKLNFKQNVAHRFDKKVMHWWYCSGCGLVALRNDVTRRSMSKPCISMEE